MPTEQAQSTHVEFLMCAFAIVQVCADLALHQQEICILVDLTDPSSVGCNRQRPKVWRSRSQSELDVGQVVEVGLVIWNQKMTRVPLDSSEHFTSCSLDVQWRALSIDVNE